jgi:hypothetical protein
MVCLVTASSLPFEGTVQRIAFTCDFFHKDARCSARAFGSLPGPRSVLNRCDSGQMTCDYFQLEDFFTAGIGCDLGGAFLLARGLINSPAELMRSATAFFDSNRQIALSGAKNRLDAIAGMIGLLVGFSLQAVGYVASLATSHTLRTGASEALVGTGLAALALSVTLITAALVRKYRLIPLLTEMARWRVDRRFEFPLATALHGFLRAAGFAPHQGEDALAFVRRVANVDDLIVEKHTGGDPQWEFPRASELPADERPQP